MRGSMQSSGAIATLSCWPPESWTADRVDVAQVVRSGDPIHRVVALVDILQGIDEPMSPP